MDKKIVWYAGGGGIKRAGPFTSQVRAWEFLRATPVAFTEERSAIMCGLPIPVRGEHVDGAHVWPEEVKII